MAQIEQDKVSMVLGGNTYTFLWGTRAIRDMQELLSTPDHLVSPKEIFDQVQRGRLKFVCAFIWAGLQKHHPKITLEQTDDILDGATEEEVDALIKKFGLRLTPAPADVAELSAGVKANPPKARPRRKRGTGETGISTRAASV